MKLFGTKKIISVCAMFLLATSSLSYASGAKARFAGDASSSSEKDFWWEDHSSDDTGDSDFGKVLKGLLNDNSLQISDGTVTVQSTEFDGEATSYTPLKLFPSDMYFRFDLKNEDGHSIPDPELFGYIGLSAQENSTSPSESFRYQYKDKKLYLSARAEDSSAKVFTLSSDSVVATLNELQEAAATVDFVSNPTFSSMPDIDLNALLKTMKSGLGSIDTSYDSDTKEYTFYTDFDEIDLGTSMTLSNLNLEVKANQAHDLTALKTKNPVTVTNHVEYDGKVHDASMEVTLDLNILANQVPEDFDSLTDEEKDAYESLDETFLALGNLPKDLDRFKLNLTGSIYDGTVLDYTKEIHLYSTLYVSTGFKNSRFDTDLFEGFGDITLYEPAQENKEDYSSSNRTSHLVELNYDVPDDADSSDTYHGVLTAEYRDKMHVKLKAQQIYDLMDEISSLSVNKTNLLYEYVRQMQTAVNKLPIMEAFKNGDFATLETGCVHGFDLNKQSDGSFELSLKIGAAMFQEGAEGDDDFVLKITPSLDSSGNTVYGVTGAFVTAYQDGKTTKIDMVLSPIQEGTEEDIFSSSKTDTTRSYTSYDLTSGKDVKHEIMMYASSTKGNFIKLDFLSLFIKFTLNTTEERFFYITGTLTLGMEGEGIIGSLAKTIGKLSGYSIHIHGEVRIDGDGNVTAYLAFVYNGKTDVTSSNFYASEFFIDENGDAYILQTWNNNYTSGSIFSKKDYLKVTSRMFKASQKDVLDNITFYILDVAMHIQAISSSYGDDILHVVNYQVNHPNSSSSQDILTKNYEDYFSDTEWDETNRAFSLHLNLCNFIHVPSITISNALITLKVSDEGDASRLTSLNVGGIGGADFTADIASVLKASVTLSADCAYGVDSSMSRYASFMAYYKREAQTHTQLQSYASVSYKENDFKILGIKATDGEEAVLSNYQDYTPLDVKKSSYSSMPGTANYFQIPSYEASIF